MDRCQVHPASITIVARDNTTDLLNQLDELKNQFSPFTSRRLERLLERLSRKKFNDTDSLVRYHEILLFLRAYPQSAAIVRTTAKEFRRFSDRIAFLIENDVDISPLQHPEISGIAGTTVTDAFGFYIVRWLRRCFPAQVKTDWEWFENENRLAETWPRFMPLLEEDVLVEANVPYRKWLAAARKGRSELSWLVDRFDELPKPDKERAELYDSQQIYVSWKPRFNISRTGLRVASGKLFYHREPLIQRRDIDLGKELAAPPPKLHKLSLSQGEKALDNARIASTIRYRELYGFTHGDPKYVYRAELGRGVELFLMGLPVEKRLPLRACHSAMIYKNGVPIGYFEGISLFERMESGFNLYYTFRDGETAWLYARTLNVFHHFTGVRAFSLDPYQIGHENEEGIESGAFWFYRKLGFRPTRKDVLQLTLKEEEKIRTRQGYRTPAATLRKLAESPMIFELDSERVGDWDRFQIRNIGFRAQGVLSAEEKQALAQIAKAKASREEVTYLRSIQKDERLRSLIIKLGS
ncbi:MAG TPA: hypothetical protein VFI24_10915 [Pyrinomonadaceae bacterium]|nr:hypothetical protein [Pyrinomonadaceae bacterium]